MAIAIRGSSCSGWYQACSVTGRGLQEAGFGDIWDCCEPPDGDSGKESGL